MQANSLGGVLTADDIVVNTLKQERMYLRGLIYGLWGEGKTALAASAMHKARTLWLLTSTEAPQARPTIRWMAGQLGINPAEDVFEIEIPSKPHLEATMNWLIKNVDAGTFPFDLIVFDSLTDLQRILKRDILKQAPEYSDKRSMRNPEVLELGEWGWLQNATEFFLTEFLALPVHIIVTAQMQDKISAPKVPYVQPQGFANLIGGYFNTVGCVRRREYTDNEGNLQSIRALVLENIPGEAEATKNPQGMLPSAMVIQPGTLVEILNAFEGKEGSE